MIEDGRKVPAGSVIRSDLCIVGAGAAGIAMARALRGSGLDVVVLESGGLEDDERTNRLNAGSLIGEPMLFGGVERPLEDTRRRFFGGSTNHWFGWCRPLDPFDFEPREWVPRSGWPIDRSDIDPWLPVAHELCELGPVEYEPATWAARYGAPAPLLDTPLVQARMFQYSPPTRFGERHRKDLAGDSHTRVLLWSNAVGLDGSPAGDHVNGVEVAVLDGPRFRVEARAYVLAMGGLEIPRLMLASSRGESAGLGNGHDLVGRMFMEHPHMSMGQAVLARSPDELGLHRISPYLVAGPEGSREQRAMAVLTLAPEAQRRFQTLNFSLFLSSIDALKGYGGSPDGPVDAAQVADLVRRFGSRMHSLARFYVISEAAPNPESRVTLSDEVDELGVPRIALDWRHSPLDRQTISVGLEVLAGELGRLDLGRVLVASDGLGPMEAPLDVGSHHMGTMRMSATPRDGVVDADCRVHGMDDLFVAGSAVFATGGCANPTLTLVALALRLAHHLRTQVLA